MWTDKIVKKDREIFVTMMPLLDELWRPLRFLGDLNSVWPDLSDVQRVEIEQSIPYREHFHEQRIEKYVSELAPMARAIRAFRHRPIRQELIGFLEHWQTREPDRVKVLVGMMRKAMP